MKKTFQKVAAILMAAMLVFFAIPAGTTAYADEPTGSITINGTEEGATYYIYQIFSLTVTTLNDKSEAYVYTANDDWATFLNTCYVYQDADEKYCFILSTDGNFSSVSDDATLLFTLNDNNVLSADSAIFADDYAENDEFLKAFAEYALDYAKTNGITETGDPVTVDEGATSATFSDVPYGWYIVSSSLGTLVMVDNVYGSEAVEITEKNGTPTIDKYITTKDQQDDTGENNGIATFIIYINDIANTTSLVLHDQLPTEMTLDTGSIVVTFYSSSSDYTGARLTKDIDYTITETSGSCTVEDNASDLQCTFEIAFTASFEAANLAGADSTAYITVQYDVTVNTETDAYTDNMDKLTNYAQLTYGTTGKTPPTEATEELFGFEIEKVDADDETIQLSDATFTLTNANGKTAYFKESSGVYYFEEWVDTNADPAGEPSDTSYTCNLVSDNGGKITIEGLDVGEYTLTETVAPDGYTVLTNSITVTISYSDGSASWEFSYDNTSIDYGNVSGDGGVVQIGNTKGGLLAQTGGIGTTIFYVVGGVIIVAAIILFITRKRMERVEKND